MKEIYLGENAEKIKKRVSQRLSHTNFATRLRIGDDGKFYGRGSDGKYTVFMLSRFVSAIFATTLHLKIEKAGDGTKVRYYFSRPLWANLFFGIALALFFVAGIFVATEDVPFAVPMFAWAGILALYLFVVPKKKKEKLLSILSKSESAEGEGKE